jgi:hypothetical protein
VLLGVDAIKGSQIIYPLQLKTKPNQQWAAERETRRRIRLALEEHGMLPGDPNRIYNKESAQHAALGVQGRTQEGEHETEKPDPTTAKSTEVNPFTGEGT